ncbi:MAG TPA: hypothetical protein VIL28_13625 [Steroidobacteraceae bacterium]
MDEYLFLVMTKLKADRLKLEREERERQRLWAAPVERSRSNDRRTSHDAERFFSKLEWREQS